MFNELAVRAEDKWKDQVIQYASELYKDQWIPSHNLAHHERVWLNACKLSEEIKSEDELYYEKLLLACYFHDLGLLFDKSEIHGKISRDLCQEFLAKNTEKVSFDVSIVLEAIEKHDNKDVQTDRLDNLVYQVLMAADDLDAFGAIGVYRYIEIYLVRGLETDKIAGNILSNASNRRNNLLLFSEKLPFAKELFVPSYRILKNILGNNSYRDTADTLVEWIQKEIVIPKSDPFQYLNNLKPEQIKNQRIKAFLNQFIAELAYKIV